jgi:hypothetical protein
MEAAGLIEERTALYALEAGRALAQRRLEPLKRFIGVAPLRINLGEIERGGIAVPLLEGRPGVATGNVSDPENQSLDYGAKIVPFHV